MQFPSVQLEKGRISIRPFSFSSELPEGYALIRLLVAGICNTDLELQRGYYDFTGIPGHEFVGEVVEGKLKGKRVVGEINLACGNCSWCLRGWGRHCPTRTVLGIVNHPGAMAEFLTLPERNLHVVPESVSNESAVFTEPLAAACEILDQVNIPKGAKVAVLGDGKLGLLISQVLQQSGLNVHQFGRHKEKLALAKGVTTELVREHMPVAEYEWTVDATGSASGLQTAVQMTQPGGTVILKSTVHGEVPLNTAPVIVNEITLVGSRCGRMEPALDLLEKGKIEVEQMIADQYSLTSAEEAFAKAATKGKLKVLLTN